MAKGVIQIISGVIVGLLWLVATAIVMTDFNGLLILFIWLVLLALAIFMIVSGIRTLFALADAAEDAARQKSPDSSDKSS